MNKFSYQAWARAFTIFAQYGGEPVDPVGAEHDIIYAGPNPAKVSEGDKAELEMLGWHESSEYECFYRFA